MPSSGDLVRVALHYCVQHAENAAVVVGFTTPEQIAENLTVIGDPLSDDDLTFIRETVCGSAVAPTSAPRSSRV